MQTQEIKDQLIQNTSSAVERGAFGIPTFFVDDEIFFGKDSLGDLEDFITK
jgi:2-hydroxychromene-2-carboxylate isomerase